MENMKSKEMQTLELANKIKAAFEKDGQDSGAASDEISKALVEFAEQKTEEMRDAMPIARRMTPQSLRAETSVSRRMRRRNSGKRTALRWKRKMSRRHSTASRMLIRNRSSSM